MFYWQGSPIPFVPGMTVAVALLQHGVVSTRTDVTSGESRGPYCLMGACFECLVQIDKLANQQACMTLAAEGMQVGPCSSPMVGGEK